MFLFDLFIACVFVVAAFLLKTGLSIALSVEKLTALFLVTLLHEPLTARVFYLVISIECLCFLAFLMIAFKGNYIVKMTTSLLAVCSSAIVFSYYSLPHDEYLTVYNSYPTTYLIIISLQILGLWYGGTGQHNIRRWMRDDANCCHRVRVLFNTCYK